MDHFQNTPSKSPFSFPSTQLIQRLPITQVSPCVEDRRWPVYSFRGEVVPFEATVFREGHALPCVKLFLTDPDGKKHKHPLHLKNHGLARWGADIQLSQEGVWKYRIGAFSDDFETWLHEAKLKIPAGTDVELMLLGLQSLLSRANSQTKRPKPHREQLRLIASMISSSEDPLDILRATEQKDVRNMFEHTALSTLSSYSPTHTLLVQPQRFGKSSWYEFFPRSIGAYQREDGSWVSGTFKTSHQELDRIAAHGFSVVYLPPIHPIGKTFRKGVNNAISANEHEPGSPWAIGSDDGGHDAIHPDLGNEQDFKEFVAYANTAGLEIALDLALQASPDHPWVRKHPEWFTHREDGTIAYAENPPKKYQDIYPINFDTEAESLYQEILRIVKYWISLGVTIFRVDNPHTKPFQFWQRLIEEVRQHDPGIIFLAEAFTRPPLLQTLAKLGFDQSYTYFTWKNTKQEITEYLSELAYETADFLRPNFFVNTPDILPTYLQKSGPAGFKVRAALAATASPIWGVYSGYELFENTALPDSEEYFESEKYQYRPRDYETAHANNRSLSPYLQQLNYIRSLHECLGQLRNIHFHESTSEDILIYSKHLDGRFCTNGKHDTLIIVMNLCPNETRTGQVNLDLHALGCEENGSFDVYDYFSGLTWNWGKHNFVEFTPSKEPVHVLHILRHD